MSPATPRRPTPEVALRRVLRAADRRTATDVMRAQLERAWADGAGAGWRAGVDDANEDEPRPQRPNPYRVRYGPANTASINPTSPGRGAPQP